MLNQSPVTIASENLGSCLCHLTLFLQLTISLHAVFWSLPYLHAEHDYLGCHGGHLVAETVLVYAVHVCRKCVLATRLTLTRVNDSFIRSNNLYGI